VVGEMQKHVHSLNVALDNTDLGSRITRDKRISEMNKMVFDPSFSVLIRDRIDPCPRL
jgi:hypothetical protein